MRKCNLLNSISLSNGEKLLYLFLIIISFTTYSALFFKELNSDHAIHVLMARDFSSFSDLYYWGQNRLGSLIPLLAHPLSYLFNPLVAVSIIQYVLIIGVIFWLLFWVKSIYWRVALILLWLFPTSFWSCQILIAHSYSGQLFFLLSSFSLLSPKISRPYLSLICFILALWCSELSIAAFPAWLLLYYVNWKRCFQQKTDWKRLIIQLFFFSVISFTFIFFLLKVKSDLPDEKNYLTQTIVPEISMLKENISRTVSHYYNSFSFSGEWKVLLSSYVRALMILWPIAVIITFFSYLRNFSLKKMKWELVWPITLFATFVVLMLSNYFHIMNSSNHYFSIFPLVSLFWLAVAKDGFYAKLKHYLVIYLLPLIIISSVYNFYSLQFTPHYKDSNRVNRIIISDFPFPEGGKIGLVGNYWNSYLFGAIYPDQVVPTPYWGDQIRNFNMFFDALESDTIVVIGKGWMESMKDSINMNYYHLVRKSPEYFYNGIIYAHYISVKIENK